MSDQATSTQPEASHIRSIPETDEEKGQRAVAQIEFYFADANLPFDKYISRIFVALSLMNKFKISGLCGVYIQKILIIGYLFRP